MGKIAAGTGVFVVKFKALPKTKPDDIKKVLGRFQLKQVSARITAKVTKKKGVFWVGDVKLSNPPKGKSFKDVLSKVGKFLKESKAELVLKGELTQDKKGKLTLTLAEASRSKKAKKKG